jgi:membrane-associated phospholipid phosphatase
MFLEEAMPLPDPRLQEELAPKHALRTRGWVFQAYLLAAILGFALLAFLANTQAYFQIDLIITRALQTYRPAWMRFLMSGVSWPGYMPQALAGVVLAVYILWKLGFPREAQFTLLAATGSGLVNILAKTVVQRPRPSADLVEVVRALDSYSFPSGHGMFYTAFFGFLFFLCFTRLKRSWARTALLILFGGLVAMVGPSRIFLGEHWASDILGAYLLGSMILLGLVQLYKTSLDVGSPVS